MQKEMAHKEENDHQSLSGASECRYTEGLLYDDYWTATFYALFHTEVLFHNLIHELLKKEKVEPVGWLIKSM